MNRAFHCIESESYLSVHQRKRYYDKCGFDKPIEFDNGDEGPTGGIQCMENANVRTSKYYVSTPPYTLPDRTPASHVH